MGPIPWTAIQDYAESHSLDEDDTLDFRYFIQELDRAHLEWINAKSAKDSAKK
jgi:hypothetical protein